ncbi:MAG: sodium:proton antiporter [Thaumarchaeota archaeon]|nr:sodium:proton antiporter [Nitrososphaerota archaeon]MDE1817512.1 sodium:proton antiporter [Nitrososphaerota archaeon]MDE1876414.1 sodium:proton antiporter [Nitrososphaerota archaeon]
MADLSLGHLLSSEFVIPVFLATIFLASLIATKVKIPYTMILVAIGISISVIDFTGHGIPNISGFKVDPKLILYFVIPPLIFEAMMRIDREQFKTIRISSLLLSTVGVGVATIVGGLLLSYLAGLPTIVAFAFAALIAPTDAAIVIEVFKRMKVPGQLATLMESEASFNDAAGAIIFSSIIAVSVAQGSLLSPDVSTGINVNILETIGHFALVFFGGISIGIGLAVGSQFLHKLLEEPLSETALSVAVLFGAVVIANSLGLSGLVAAAAAGLWFGVIMRKPHIISEKVRAYTTNFWEMIAFFANSVAFLYLGLNMDIVRIGQNIPLIALAIIIVLAARAASTYPILAATHRFTKEKTKGPWRHVVMIGGMRGALSVALVATLPESEFKEILKTITFGVVLSSLILQYPILSRYIKKAFPEAGQETPSS